MMKTFDRWYVRVPSLHPVIVLALVNFCLLAVVMAGFYSFFANPSGIEVRMPRLLSGTAEENRSTVDITAENVLYLDGKVVTLNDLKKVLAGQRYAPGVIFVRADRRASLGRVADVLYLCRGLNAGRVHIVAAREK